MRKHNLFTSNFNGTILFLLKLFLLFVFVIGYIYKILPQYANSYNAGLIDKVNRLESIKEPKIVLVGNSSLAFGIDSKMIEDAFGMPVVNLGLHGGTGNVFAEEMSKLNVTEGDIYILCHTDFYDDNNLQDPMVTWLSVENHLDLWRIIRPRDYKQMLDAFPVYFRKCLDLYSSFQGNLIPSGFYRRDIFNEYGDVAIERKGCEFQFVDSPWIAHVRSETLSRINELNSYINKRGAKLVVAGYPIANGEFTEDVMNVVKVQKEIQEGLDCPVISNYVEYMYDYSYFYNSDLHLNTKGAELRTKQLIADLKSWQQDGQEKELEEDTSELIFDNRLCHINDFSKYLDALEKGKERYTIFISIANEAFGGLNDQILGKINLIGAKADFSECYGSSYAIVIDGGEVLYEGLNSELLYASGRFDEDEIEYSIVSAGADAGSVSSIIIDDSEYSKNVRGMNIVVYSNELNRVIDSVSFETTFEAMVCTRNKTN